jgi:hypothetical protein
VAVRTPTVSYAPNGQRDAVLVTWTGLLNGDTGTPVEVPAAFGDRTMQVSGTTGVGGSITLEGSNDNTNFIALTDPQGNAVTKTAAAMEVIEEAPRYVRPNVTAGDGSTSFTVTVWARRSR